MLPIPKPASPPNSANAVASQRQRPPRPLRMTYIGPPTCSRLSSTSRYFTASTISEYLVAMPTSAVIHIQNSAPGPPTAIAVATPAMLPVPTVAESSVISAANGEMSPCALLPGVRLPHSMRKPCGILRIGMKPRRSCRYRPVPRIRTIIGIPQTMSFKAVKKSCRNCIGASPSCLSFYAGSDAASSTLAASARGGGACAVQAGCCVSLLPCPPA